MDQYGEEIAGKVCPYAPVRHGRQMDTSTPEGQIHVSNYLSVVMSPAFAFMRIVGIYHITMIKPLKAALIIYNLLIIAVQVSPLHYRKLA
uniref:Elongation of very long chain fatty acids protein n=1 Tax=Ascaris lumbricoides TaxID=6252 RepID=A0A0M3IQ49_ASCLU